MERSRRSARPVWSLVVTVAALLGGCSREAAVCDGEVGACVAVHVTGTPPRLDGLTVELTEGATTRRYDTPSRPRGAFDLPADFALILPDGSSGRSFVLDLYGRLGVDAVSHGSKMFTYDATLLRLDVELRPGSGPSRDLAVALDARVSDGAASNDAAINDLAVPDGGVPLDGAFDAHIPDASGPCSAGEQRTVACGFCGNQVDTCTNAGMWSPGVCTGAGECAPGTMRAGMCNGCSQQTCEVDCHWSACALKPGNSCEFTGYDQLNQPMNRQPCGCTKACSQIGGSVTYPDLGSEGCLPSCQWDGKCRCAQYNTLPILCN